MQWWNQANKSCWEFEQLNIEAPLSEWALTMKDQPRINSFTLIPFYCNVFLGGKFLQLYPQGHPC